VTIVPRGECMTFWRAISQPTADDIVDFFRAGERATWPLVDAIAELVRLEQVLSALAARYTAAGVARRDTAAAATFSTVSPAAPAALALHHQASWARFDDAPLSSTSGGGGASPLLPPASGASPLPASAFGAALSSAFSPAGAAFLPRALDAALEPRAGAPPLPPPRAAPADGEGGRDGDIPR